MAKYDNYNPEIIYGEEPPAPLPPEEPDKTPDKKQTRAAGRKSAKNAGSRKTAARVTAKTPEVPFAERVKLFATSLNVRLVVGILLACLCVYLGVAFISYFSECVRDQSAIRGIAVGYAGQVRNAGGEGGARLANFLINDTFGLGSLVILVWLAVMSLKELTGHPRLKSVNFTIKCLVALITVSLIIGLLTIGLDTPVNWGGLNGRYVNEFIIRFVGMTGAVLLCLFMIALFVVICLRDIINWILRLKRKRDAHKAAVRARREAERERQALIEEMARMELADARNAGEQAAAEDESESEDSHVSFEEEASSPESMPDYEDPFDEHLYSIDDEQTAVESQVVCRTVVKEEPAVGGEEDVNTVDDDATNGSAEPMVVNVNQIVKAEGADPQVPQVPGKLPWKFPPAEILRPGVERVSVDQEELLEKQESIRKTLADFGIGIVRIEATVGPTVTLYEIVPDQGVRIARIRSLVDDIALSLSATGVRIIAPIPGKGTVGIEVANKDPQMVSMRTVIQSKKYRECKYKLPVAIGCTISNEVYINDLSKMPHLLVAGATGQGKSVGLNAIIASLLYRKTPEELKFVMVDPKMVEFSLYAKIEKHYLAKLPDEEDAIITDMGKVVATLNSLCIEMDNRYMLLKAAHARNIEEYNAKMLEKKLNPLEGHRFLPYIVVIVDEFSDLIMTSGKEVEMPIARLAQKARAVGMHVIIATQRPSTNVITGIIKANFPARIAFKVSSGVDSKTILDTTGAQQLIGRGDMLVSSSSDMERLQCAFIDTPEVEELCDYIERQPYGSGAYILPEPMVSDSEQRESGAGESGEIDSLLFEAARTIINSSTASTSSLQRRYRIGYNRAGAIMDQLERIGVVGPSHGGKPRAVLVDANTLEEILSKL